MKAVDLPLINSNECEKKLRQTALKRTFVLDKESFLCAGGKKIYKYAKLSELRQSFIEIWNYC